VLLYDLAQSLLQTMRPFLISTLTFILSVIIGISATIYMKSLQARVEGTNVKLEWVISEETGVQKYLVYRKQGSNQQYLFLTSVNPNGTKTYSFTDINLTTNSGAENITYKIIVDAQSQDYEFFTTVSYSSTAVQRTWGSIKAMFK